MNSLRPRPAAIISWAALTVLLLAAPALGRNAIRNSFFSAYPAAQGTRLATLASNDNHCGLCHFNFDGAGSRTPYGNDVKAARDSGDYPNDAAAILSLHDIDSDGDGYTNGVEITDIANYSNTPTFPGLTAGNLGSASNVNPAEIAGHLTPLTAADTTPPDVLVIWPNGGEIAAAGSFEVIQWSATDASGVAGVDILLSDDGGAHYRPVALGLGPAGGYDWFVPNRPGALNRIRVVARDNAGNSGHDDSNGNFTITPVAGGVVPTTLRDFDLAGSQPFDAGVLEDPSAGCNSCHGGYDEAVEPWRLWRGSMMAHAARDPLYLATLVIAEQDAPGVGDLCLRCHTPGGWLEGRSTDTSGGMLTAKDRHSVHCDFCHRQVDPIYVEGVSPPQDALVLGALEAVPLAPANGQFVVDFDPAKRGPYDDAVAPHQSLRSPFHRPGDLCGTCHDVSNPVFVRGAGQQEYAPQAFDTEHPDGDLRNMFPVERTFSEWQASEYASTGVYAPQFAGNLPGGIVSTCQDCHMRRVTGRGASEPGTPIRTDLPLHDMTGGNHFVPDLLPDAFPGEVDAGELAAGKQRVLDMLQLACTLELTPGRLDGLPTLLVRVINETGHKLPSGYPEGRRVWINVRGYDDQATLVYESGAYNAETGELSHDPDAKIYHTELGFSTRLAAVLGRPAGPTFHFALNDTIYLDNRIPPRGFNNAAFAAAQAAPVAYAYEDGQYWDDTEYLLPAQTRSATVTVYYQSTSREYVEFLRDANVTNDLGQQLYAAWVAQGRAAPVVMATQSTAMDMTDVAQQRPPARDELAANIPNPFNPTTVIPYALARDGQVRLRIFDAAGRLVRTLVDERRPAGKHGELWDGRDGAGRGVASGVYFYRLETERGTLTRKLVLAR